MSKDCRSTVTIVVRTWRSIPERRIVCASVYLCKKANDSNYRDVGARESWLIASPSRPAFHLTPFYLSNGDKIVDLQDHADTFCAQGDFRGVHE